MPVDADRIRRILSDAGGGVRRASDIAETPLRAARATDAAAPSSHDAPALGRAAAAPPRSGPDAEGPRPLLDRLRALRAGESVRDRAASGVGAIPREGRPLDARLVVPRLALPEDDGRTLEEHVGGAARRGPKGSFHEVVRRHPLSGIHGDVPLSRLLDAPIPLRARERRAGGATHVRPEDAAWLDVETTGLAGGTGTVAFLVGVGRVDGDAFVVRQYFLRDFPDEPPALEALAADLGDSPLVTFNGRAFDWPLLSTRFRLHRIPVAERDHVDLLPVARRVWAGSLESHSLGELERRVLGVEREDDLPGSLVPAAYFAWLREARAAGVAAAFRHNEIDVVSMAALAVAARRALAEPDGHPAADPRDAHGRAALLLQHGDATGARRILERTTSGPAERAPRRSVLLLGRLLRRLGDVDAAVALWSRHVEADLPFDAVPVEEVAKALEHGRRDAAAALSVVERALRECPGADPRRSALLARAARLRRKAASARDRRRPPVGGHRRGDAEDA